MSTLHEIYDLLTKLEKQFPPKEYCHHAMLANNEKLMIQFAFSHGMVPVILEPEELEMTTENLFDEIVELFKTLDNTITS